MQTKDGSDLAIVLDGLRDEGFAVARGQLEPALLAELTAEADDLVGRFRAGHRSEDYWCYDEPGQELPLLYRIHNLERQGAPAITELFAGGVVRDLAEALLGPIEPTVCAMVVKTPGVAGVPWHRDRADVPPMSALNLSVFLDEASSANGCFEAVPGSHRLPDDIDVEQTRAGGPVVAVPARPGDILIHDVRLVHGSGDNTSASIRRSIIIEFAAAGTDGRGPA